MEEGAWRRASLAIRREHECFHTFTGRLFTSMRNNLLDEVIADYMGIVGAAGRYRADWFLRFVGLESFPAYRKGGRLENYKGAPPLSDAALAILQALVKDAAGNLERLDQGQPCKALVAYALTYATLEELACESALGRLGRAITELREQVSIS